MSKTTMSIIEKLKCLLENIGCNPASVTADESGLFTVHFDSYSARRLVESLECGSEYFRGLDEGRREGQKK